MHLPLPPAGTDHGDLDHQRPYRDNDPSSGGTDKANLHPPCKNHHVLKHEGRRTLHTNTDTGRRRGKAPPATPMTSSLSTTAARSPSTRTRNRLQLLTFQTLTFRTSARFLVSLQPAVVP